MSIKNDKTKNTKQIDSELQNSSDKNSKSQNPVGKTKKSQNSVASSSKSQNLGRKIATQNLGMKNTSQISEKEVSKEKNFNNKNSSNSECKNKNMHNKALGQRGEEAACAYLKNKGYEIIARNWKCHVGEADIIAIIDDVLVFVEVKTRSNIDTGLPEDAVTPLKRNKYERIAAMYLRETSFVDMSIRFDVIAILTVNKDKAMLRHHINAFGVA